MHRLRSIPEVSCVRFKDALNLGVGLESGHVGIYDRANVARVVQLLYLGPSLRYSLVKATAGQRSSPGWSWGPDAKFNAILAGRTLTFR